MASQYGAHTLRQLHHLYPIIPIILCMPALELNNTVFTRPHHRTHAGSGESSPQPHIPSHLVLILMLSYHICPFTQFDAPNNCPSPRSWVKLINTLAVWYEKRLLSPAQRPNWCTTPSRLSVTAYFLYLQLFSIIVYIHSASPFFMLISLNKHRIAKSEMQATQVRWNRQAKSFVLFSFFTPPLSQSRSFYGRHRPSRSAQTQVLFIKNNAAT